MRTISFAVAVLMLLVGAISAQAQHEIQGQVTIQGRLGKDKDSYVVEVGAGYATFVLRKPNGEDTRLLQTLVGKGILLKGRLQSEVTGSGLILGVEATEIRANGGDVFDHKVEGEVQVRGLLTKEVWLGAELHRPSPVKGEAFLLHRVPGMTFSAVRFTGDVAKKAESLYGCNVMMRCKLESHGLGSRGQTFTYVLKDLQAVNK